RSHARFELAKISAELFRHRALPFFVALDTALVPGIEVRSALPKAVKCHGLENRFQMNGRPHAVKAVASVLNKCFPELAPLDAKRLFVEFARIAPVRMSAVRRHARRDQPLAFFITDHGFILSRNISPRSY